jgi:multimeric flavodoxin WrbA
MVRQANLFRHQAGEVLLFIPYWNVFFVWSSHQNPNQHRWPIEFFEIKSVLIGSLNGFQDFVADRLSRHIDLRIRNMTGIRYVTILCGSERDQGNTEQISEYAGDYLLRAGHKVDIFRLRLLKIAPCGTCGNCNWKSSPCQIDDDMRNVIETMVRSDAVIYAARVHGFGMAHLMQVFLERAGVCFLRFNRPLENKIGDVIAIGRRYNIGHVHDQLVNNVLLNRMIKAGSGYPVVLNGGQPGSVFNDEEGMSALHGMLDRLSSLLIHIRPHLEGLQKVQHQNERLAVKEDNTKKVID